MNNKIFQKTINWVFTFVLTLGLFLPAGSTLALPQKAGPAAQPAQAITPVNPDDTKYADGSQWNLNGAWGINAPMAWGITSGSATTIVAVLDTGFTDHLDLDPARILPGYDFVSDVTNNDNDGRDGEPHDPGDYGSCGDSSWQGTRTAGIIGAASDNALGVAGIDWSAKILPVRVIGTCGSAAALDIVDGMRWAAGLPVGGVATNPNPAKVIHVSASLPGVACTTAYQADVDAIINDKGAVIVAPAGDQGAATNNFPSNCAGVITVAATDLFGKRASYSNYSGTLSVVEISAPGGGNGQLNVFSTTNSGANSANTLPEGSIYDTTMQGTSIAAAHVSGVVSLMFAANPYITPDKVLKILQKTAKGFNTSVGGDPLPWCTTSNCGSGIVDAGEAVRVANMPDLVITDVTVVQTSVDPDPYVADVSISIQNQGGLNLLALNNNSIVYRDVYVDLNPVDMHDTDYDLTGCLIIPDVPDYAHFFTENLNATIPSGATTTDVVTISGLPGGSHQIYAYADAECNVDESFEDNHYAVALPPVNVGVTSNAPILISPADKSLSNIKIPKLTVQAATGAVSYQFQVSSEETFTDPLKIRVDFTPAAGITSYTLTLAQALPYGTYYWRARSNLSAGGNSDWSVPNKFGVTFQISPAYNSYSTIVKPTFTWTAVAGALGYYLQVSKTDTPAGWAAPEIDRRLGKVTSFISPINLDYGARYWRVRACSDSLCTAFLPLPPEFDFSSKFTLTPPLSAVPVLVSPLTKALLASKTPTLTWKKVMEDDRYQVQIDNLSTFASPERDFVTATGSVSYTPTTSPTALADGIYYWRVRTSNYLTAPGAWSLARSFTIDTTAPLAPVLSLPAAAIPPAVTTVIGTPIFSWKASLTATKYQFQYDNDENLLTPAYTSAELTTLTHTPPTMTPGIYYWHVRAKDPAGNWSLYSAPRPVTIALPKPLAPVLTAPATGTATKDQTPSFSWNAVAYGATYQIDISTTSAFPVGPTTQTAIVPSVEGNLTYTYTPVDDLPVGLRYWRVQAKNTASDAGPFSLVRSFTVDITPPLEPALSLPAINAAVIATPTFSWLAAATAAKYKFEYDDDVNFGSPYASAELTTLAHKPPTMLPGTYYWRVTARDAAGNWSLLPGISRRVTILPAPTLTLPVKASIIKNTTPEFRWSVVAGSGVTYRLEISTVSTFTPGLATQTLAGLGTPPYTLAAPLTPLTPDGVYYWRVRAENSAPLLGPWSLTSSFTLDTVAPLAPVLKAPLNNAAASVTPTFSWASSLTAVKYKFEYATDFAFTNVVYAPAELATLTYKPPTMASGTYYWRVSARDAAGNWGVSAPYKITILPAPGLLLPANASLTNDSTPDFSWNPVAGTDITYEIQISTNTTFTLLVPQTATVIGTTYTAEPALSGGLTSVIYYWHVRAVSGGSVFGPWSAYRYFTVDATPPLAPVLSAPAAGASVTGTPIFSWAAASTATKYQFEYATAADFITNLVTFPEQTTLNITLPSPIAPGTYYWRVRAKDAAGNWSLYSTARTLTILPKPPAPVVTGPVNLYVTNNSTPEFSWKAVGGSVTYDIQISTNATFTLLVPQTATGLIGITYTPLDALPGGDAIAFNGKVYYWRVRAVVSPPTDPVANGEGAWSAYRSFTVDTVAPLAPPVLVSPAAAVPPAVTSVIGTPTFSWKAVLNATSAFRYQFQYDIASDFANAEADLLNLHVTDPLHATYYTSAELTALTFTHKPTTMSLGTYYWHVRVRDAAGNWTAWSAPRQVSVTPLASTGVPILLGPINGKIITDPDPVTLSWKVVIGAVSYRVEMDKNSTFSSPDFFYTTPALELNVTAVVGLDPGTYYWRVRKIDKYGGVAPWSAVWRLSVNQVIPLSLPLGK